MAARQQGQPLDSRVGVGQGSGDKTEHIINKLVADNSQNNEGGRIGL